MARRRVNAPVGVAGFPFLPGLVPGLPGVALDVGATVRVEVDAVAREATPANDDDDDDTRRDTNAGTAPAAPEDGSSASHAQLDDTEPADGTRAPDSDRREEPEGAAERGNPASPPRPQRADLASDRAAQRKRRHAELDRELDERWGLAGK
ncbi:hypothetical protein GGS23DRAFT_597491 [Durotheca rogersii]|uniref:uncharacterized protein n=1 Tax=Durotheca rogersii TaxID=419775 RepID=UPI00221FEF1D|nr:uncharacterized protein GGS23DRAFT_597491 [Durotheca rogersii]KAI5862709.1 hypothetical protein GGS23DRAFT_597491 [Durotheca rogersii]